MEHLDFFTCDASFDSSDLGQILGRDVTGNVQYGWCFPVRVENKKFHLELLYIHWDNDLIELHPKVVHGGETIQTLHGRLRLSAKVIETGRYRGKRMITLRQALLKKGITLHSNLTQASLDDMDRCSGIDTAATLVDMGAIAIGSKEDVLKQKDNKRNELCVIFRQNDVVVPISAFIISRVLPVYFGHFSR